MATVAKKRLSPSLEDYLEAVLDLVQTDKVARVRDIARRLKVGMPSVSSALRALAQRGLVNYDPYQVITLTAQGQRLAREIGRRHNVLHGFLANVLKLDEATAQANACRMEHAVDPVVLDRLEKLTAFIQICPRIGQQWSDIIKMQGVNQFATKLRRHASRRGNVPTRRHARSPEFRRRCDAFRGHTLDHPHCHSAG
jgi:DtxR family Mn-dependent transcriptional regulator